jgi:hypothetical protein
LFGQRTDQFRIDVARGAPIEHARERFLRTGPVQPREERTIAGQPGVRDMAETQ